LPEERPAEGRAGRVGGMPLLPLVVLPAARGVRAGGLPLAPAIGAAPGRRGRAALLLAMSAGLGRERRHAEDCQRSERDGDRSLHDAPPFFWPALPFAGCGPSRTLPRSSNRRAGHARRTSSWLRSADHPLTASDHAVRVKGRRTEVSGRARVPTTS